MAVTQKDAERVLEAADVARRAPDEAQLIVGRVAICQAVLAYCGGGSGKRVRWDTPMWELTGASGDEADATCGYINDLFWQLDLEGDDEWDRDDALDGEAVAAVKTFGDLVLLVEARVRVFWNPDAVIGCPSQALFYQLRRAVALQPGARNSKPHPRHRLEDILPGPDAEAFCALLATRFGARDLPRSQKVFGLLPLDVTWLVCWILALVFGAFPLMRYPIGWFGAYFVASGIGVGLLLGAVSRETWNYDLTLADLTRRTLRHNADAATALRTTLATWAA